MNIVIDGHSLQFIGGMERVICELASALAERGHQVFLFISDTLSNKPVYTLHPKIQLVQYTHGGRQKHLAKFRKQILDCTPDVCISSAADRRHLPWCAALWNTGIPLVISEHCTPAAVENIFWNRIERLAVMAGADAIHLLRPSCVNTLPPFLQHKVHVIPNAVCLPAFPKQSAMRLTICSIGRLDRDKQNALLVDAASLLQPEFPQWQIDIWGTGPEVTRLRRQIARHGLEQYVFLRGVTHTPEISYANSEIVCLPSRHEAFPGALTEAMTAGLPTVGFAHCPGVNELIQHGVTGLLAPEMTAANLAKTLHALMADSTLRQRMGRAASEAAKAFLPISIYNTWEYLLFQVAARKGKTQLQTLASATTPPELREHSIILKCCIVRPNVLLGDKQYLQRLIFQFPWLKRLLHPLYTRFKSFRQAQTNTVNLSPRLLPPQPRAK